MQSSHLNFKLIFFQILLDFSWRDIYPKGYQQILNMADYLIGINPIISIISIFMIPIMENQDITTYEN